MTDFRALCAELTDALDNLHALVWGECPRLLNEDQGGSGFLDLEIEETLTTARAALAQPEQDDKTLNAIRETTPRYRMSVIVSTTDSAIDTRMNVIWQALDLSKEILESVSLPEQLPPPPSLKEPTPIETVCYYDDPENLPYFVGN